MSDFFRAVGRTVDADGGCGYCDDAAIRLRGAKADPKCAGGSGCLWRVGDAAGVGAPPAFLGRGSQNQLRGFRKVLLRFPLKFPSRFREGSAKAP